MAVGYYDDDVMCDGMVTCYVWSREIKYFKYNNRPFQLILKTTLTINATSISLPPSLTPPLSHSPLLPFPPIVNDVRETLLLPRILTPDPGPDPGPWSWS